MRNLLQQLENNEAILLMYLADELDPQDRDEVGQLLKADASLSAQLRQMRADQQMVATALESLDQQSPALTAASASRQQRQLSRLIRQWQVDRLARPPKAPAARSFHLPRWSYPVAAAAAVLFAVLGWWGMKSDPLSTVGSQTVATDINATPTPAPPTDAAPPVNATPETSWALLVPEHPSTPQEPGASEAQQQASALGTPLTTSIFMTDNNE